MNRNRLAAIVAALILLAFGAVQVGAQGTITLESLHTRLNRTDTKVVSLERKVRHLEEKMIRLERGTLATPTRRPTATPRPTVTRRPTPKPTATLNPAMQAALDESTANQWANAALDKARREKGLDWRKGGWMEWYNRPNLVKVFLGIVDSCDLTGEELVAEIEKYERDRTVVAMNNEHEPNITTEIAIFRDYNRAARNDMKPCSKLVEQFKNLYKK